MTLSRNLRKAIERSDFAAVEDDWLARLDEDSSQIEYFVAVARSLAGAGQSDRARLLLELVDEQLRKSGDWERRLELMERVGELHPAGDKPHAEILSTLERIYEGLPSLGGLIELVGLHRAVDDIPRTWSKVENLRQMMQFEMNSVVAMEGKGVGRIVEVNLELASFKIDFAGVGEIRVGFKAAGKLLAPLAEDHFLRRKLESPEELETLEPSELLRQLLESSDRPLQASEIKQAVNGLLGSKPWSSWWTAARKHRQLVTEGTGAKRTYRWAHTDAAAGEAVLEQFRRAKLDRKLKIFRKEAGRDAELGRSMSDRLGELGAARATREPEVAFAVASELERQGLAAEDSPWSTEALVIGGKDPTEWILEIGDKTLRREALALVRKRPDWDDLFLRLLGRESEPKLLDYLAEELRAADPRALDALLDATLSQPRRQPALFVWAAERIGGDDLLVDKSPSRLMQMIPSVGERPEFAPYKSRLKQLVSDGNCLAVLISRVADEQAEAAEDALRRAHLEEYQRERLETALHMRFPRLRREPVAGLYATAASIEARRAELKELLEVDIPANRKAIEEARELGDLRENFEYKSARQRHEYLSARVAKLDGALRRVQPIDLTTVDGSEVRVGARVALRGSNGDRKSITILGPWESRPEENIVSYESDLARKLLGKSPGDGVDLFGDEMTIESIAPAGSPSS